MRILVIGSGAREHAIVKSLIRTGTPREDIVCAPGNEGIASEVETREVDQVDRLAVVKLALEERVDLVVIGPEAPLVAGVADALREQGVAVFGPNQDAAQLEGSKNFAKEVMAAADVPTGMAHQCTTMEEVENALDQFGAPFVVKADGLAAGTAFSRLSFMPTVRAAVRKVSRLGLSTLFCVPGAVLCLPAVLAMEWCAMRATGELL